LLARDITAEQYRFVAKRRALQCLDDPFSGEEFDVPEEELNYLKKYFLGKNNRVADKSRKENDRLDISAEEGSDKEEEHERLDIGAEESSDKEGRMNFQMKVLTNLGSAMKIGRS